MTQTPLAEGLAKTKPEYAHNVVANEYGFYCVPEAYGAREVPQVLARGEVYEPATLRLMQRICGENDIIAGGAFIGDFLPALSGAVGKNALVHTFEPNPISHQAASYTMALNGLKNVRLHECAVGSEDGILPLQVAQEGDVAMAARAKLVAQAEPGKTLDVAVRRLDDLIEPTRRVSLLQLDIEGSELPALLGAQAIIRANRPTIILEAPKPWQQRKYAVALAEHFPQIPYQLCGVMERNCLFRPLP